MNRNVSTRVLTAAARPARPTALRPAGPRLLPKKKGIVGRIVRWFVFLSIVGAVVASFFVKAPDGNTYADLYTIPASKWAYHWAKEKISPAETEEETPKKDAGPSELDTRFEEAVAQRQKAEGMSDETAAALEKELEAAGRRIDVVREVGVAASKPAPRKTRVGTAQAVEELAAQAAAQKKIAAGLAKRKSEADVKAALAAVPPPPPPPPPAPPPPPPVVSYDLRKLHAWPMQPAGTWVRWKKTAGETVSFEDHVLATLTDEAAVVRIEAGNQTTGERVFVFGAEKARVVREESVKIGDAEIPCRVVQSGSTIRWIAKEGPGADRVALKTQVGDQTVAVTEIAEEEVPVKGEAKKCLKVTTGDVTVWGHDDVPGFAVRVKTATETAEATGWGADLAARPATRNPADEFIEKLLLNEADRLKGEGGVMLREVTEAMKDMPETQEALRPLFLKLETVTALLTKSREVFLLAKEKTPASAVIEENLWIVGRALEIATRHTESIKSRLKPGTN